jgi:hypothetical protein
MVAHGQDAGSVGKVVRKSRAICNDHFPVAARSRKHEPQVDIEVAKPYIHLNAELFVSLIYLDEALGQCNAPRDVFAGLALASQDFLWVDREH